MSTRIAPNHVDQIKETQNFHTILPALHVFNSLVLDDKLRWYAEPVIGTAKYWKDQTEFEQYMQTIDNKTMDFVTIKTKIFENKYTESKDAFSDMELVFLNALKFNAKESVWFAEAQRLYHLLLALRQKKEMRIQNWKPKSGNIRFCPKCANILRPLKATQPIIIKCNHCLTDIKCQKSHYFVCNNHKNGIQSFCTKCVQTLTKENIKNANVNERKLENNESDTNVTESKPMKSVSFLSALSAPATVAQCEYMSDLWQNLSIFSSEMRKATVKYKNAITETEAKKRKANEVGLNQNRNEPLFKKQKRNGTHSIYKLKKWKSAWLFYLQSKMSELKRDKSEMNGSERMKFCGREWKSLSEKRKRKWVTRAETEKQEYLRVKKAFEEHQNFKKVPLKWKQIDKKAVKARLKKESESEK